MNYNIHLLNPISSCDFILFDSLVYTMPERGPREFIIAPSSKILVREFGGLYGKPLSSKGFL